MGMIGERGFESTHSDPARAPAGQQASALSDIDVQRASRRSQTGQAADIRAAMAAVQRADVGGGACGEDSAQVHEAAAHGVSGGGGQLPHLDAIQRAFGPHDVSGVQAHVGGEAAEASAAMGAQAYATGNDVAFGQSPDLHTAAHEAAHVVQQRGGVSLKGGVGQVGDPYERHADAVADRVVQGESAVDLLDQMAGGGGAIAGAPGGAIQRYAETDIGGEPWRVSDGADVAVRQDHPVYGGRHFYARSNLISASNSTLQGQGSSLELSADSGQMTVTDKAGQPVTLDRVEPSSRADATAGNDRAGGMMWPEDCGQAANTVMQGAERDGRAVYTKQRQKSFVERVVSYLKSGDTSETIAEQQETPERTYGTSYYRHRGRKQYSPQKMLNDIFEDVSGENFDKAWTDYQALSATDRSVFDELVGLNEHAEPEVGEAYSIVANRDENIDQKTWNFHWGAVVMRSGGDSVTLENFAGSGEDAWDFQMYGPAGKGGQTFHEQQEQRTKKDGTPEYGHNPTTIRVRTE